jgi:hypothetical protein
MKNITPVRISPLWRRLVCSVLHSGEPRFWTSDGNTIGYRCKRCRVLHKGGW